jgi:hypothetical protein
MSRRQRELEELHDLCVSGAVARAVDLAFEHFARFGRREEIIDLLAAAIERTQPGGRASQRLAELRNRP